MISPISEAELAEAVRGAAGPLRIMGGGTRDIGAPVVGDVLSVSGITGVRLYEPGALTLVAGAGTPLAEVEAVLAAEGQRLAFEPMDHRGLLGQQPGGGSTIGGVVAGNVSGPRRIQAGACRDSLIGVRFVDGMGAVIKNGGRVMKNVTGYDLVKLMAGSWGSLGVLSEAAFKVQAIPEAEATLIGEGLDSVAGVQALTRALGSPYDVTGAAHIGPELTGARSRTLVRVEGMAGAVAHRSQALAQMLGFSVVTGRESAGHWAEIRDVRAMAGRDGAVWRVSVKPTDGPVVRRLLLEAGLEHAALFDWGGGLVWLLVEGAAGGADAGAGVIRRVVAGLGGHATLVRGSAALRRAVPVFSPEPAPLAALAASLRARFDPRGILNPGIMG